MSPIARRKAVAEAYELYGRMLDLDDAHIEDAVRTALGAAYDAGAATNQGAVEALRLMMQMYERHERWCGYNPDAPGDMIVNVATDAARDVLYDHRGQ